MQSSQWWTLDLSGVNILCLYLHYHIKFNQDVIPYAMESCHKRWPHTLRWMSFVSFVKNSPNQNHNESNLIPTDLCTQQISIHDHDDTIFAKCPDGCTHFSRMWYISSSKSVCFMESIAYRIFTIHIWFSVACTLSISLSLLIRVGIFRTC